MTKTLLAVYAHPDDEAFGTGGSLTHYTAQGIRVVLVCATRGEVGEISDPSYATPETLGQVRESELRCAAETMGISEVIFLDYRDSGMAGTAENEDPRAFINAPADEVIAKVVAIIRRVQPDIVVTFEPNGGYGHPDHIAIHKHTVAAFRAASDPSSHPGLGTAWKPQRLFYSAIPRSFFREMVEQLKALGENVSDFERFEEEGRGWPDEKVNVTIDVSKTVEAKWEALECHRTQFGPANLFKRLPEKDVKKLMSREYYALAWPEQEPGSKLPDLFAGLQN
ncbi:MAG: PIG-L family deacetylase [Anaerolineales bacterium]|nr:MAG: PIG-L family deacetylase [Anaerolineales bacterium]